ncbi:MAG TPA: Flp family type IVb pilin [Alphaproteobacteria bacterium]|jgi:pilus assembly protein Flp/PilA
MHKILATFMRDESGATAIEYGLIASLMGIGLIAALQELGQVIIGIYDDLGRALDRVTYRMR